MTKQVNIELPEEFAREIKADAALFGVTLNDYGRVALELFKAKNKLARASNLEGAKRKIVGRPVAPKKNFPLSSGVKPSKESSQDPK